MKPNVRVSLTNRKLVLTATVPRDSRYPKTLKTIGDHIRTVRLDQSLEMKDVAIIIGVSETSIFDWEHNRKNPSFSYYPSIISFLGYEPEEMLNKRLFVEQFENFRQENNLTIYFCATRMGMCPKQLKKLLNQEMELSELYKSWVREFTHNLKI